MNQEAGCVIGRVISPPPETVAVVVRLKAASLATFTATVIGGKWYPPAECPNECN